MNSYFNKVVICIILFLIISLGTITAWKINKCIDWYLGNENEVKLQMLNTRIYNLEGKCWKLEEEIYKIKNEYNK